jgi:hypothetical protein
LTRFLAHFYILGVFRRGRRPGEERNRAGELYPVG